MKKMLCRQWQENYVSTEDQVAERDFRVCVGQLTLFDGSVKGFVMTALMLGVDVGVICARLGETDLLGTDFAFARPSIRCM